MRGFERVEHRYERRQRKRRLSQQIKVVLAFILAVIFLLINAQYRYEINSVFQKWNFLFRGAIPTPSEITMVVLDEHTLAEYGEPPLPRLIYAEAFEKLSHYSPKLLLIDYAFPPDRKETEANLRMGEALANLPSVLGSGIIRDIDGSLVKVGNDPSITAGIKKEISLELRQTAGIVSSITAPVSATATADEQVPFIGVLEQFLGTKFGYPKLRDLINFYGPPTSFPRVTVKELEGDLSNTKYAEQLNGKVVVFGLQKSREAALQQRDDEQISVSYSDELMYGAEIHATILGNLLHKNWITTIDNDYEGLIPLFAVFLIAIMGFFCSIPVAFAAILTLVVVGIIGTYFAFSHWLIWIPTMPIILIFSICSIAILTPFRMYLSKRLDKLIDRRLMGDL